MVYERNYYNIKEDDKSLETLRKYGMSRPKKINTRSIKTRTFKKQ